MTAKQFALQTETQSDKSIQMVTQPVYETFAPQPQPIEPQPNKMFLLCLFLQIKVVKGKIQSIYIKGVLLTLINWINITNNIPNMVKNTR